MSQAHGLPAVVPAASANHTQVPNVVFDTLLAELSGAQLKVLLYIIRRLAGFHKSADRIAVEQIVHGIVTRDGRRLDCGAGVARSTAIEALQYLVENGYLLAAANRAPGGRDLPTTYALGPRLLPPRTAEPPARTIEPAGDTSTLSEGSTNRTPPQAPRGRESGAARVRKGDGQKKESQNKEPDSIPRPPESAESTPAAAPAQPPYSPYIAGVVLDFSQALGDALHGPANVTQALRLWQGSGQDEATFVRECLYPAYGRVRVYQGKQGPGCIANKMAYFFEVLRSLLAPATANPAPEETPPAVTAPGPQRPSRPAPASPVRPGETQGLDAHKYLHGKYAHLFGTPPDPAAAAATRLGPDLL